MDFEKILNELLKQLQDLQMKGQFSFTLDSIEKIAEVDGIIEDILIKKGYYESIKDYKPEFNEALLSQIKAYGAFGAKIDKSLTAYNTAAYNIFHSKLVGFAETNIKQPLKDALFQYISSEGKFKDFRDTVKEILQTQKIETNFDNIAKEFIFQYKRAQGQNLARKYSVKYWRYVGGEIDTTRDFCEMRNRNIYTEDEIRSWAKEEWAGKIKGTTEANIMQVLGGHKCRHDLMPIPESVALREGYNKYNKLDLTK